MTILADIIINDDQFGTVLDKQLFFGGKFIQDGVVII